MREVRLNIEQHTQLRAIDTFGMENEGERLTSDRSSGTKSQCGENGSGNYRRSSDSGQTCNNRNERELVDFVSSGTGEKGSNEFELPCLCSSLFLLLQMDRID